jgi:hypothetical protein
MMQVLDCPAEEKFVAEEDFVAIRNDDWPTIHKAIADAIAPLKPSGWRKALFLLREWGVLGTIAAIIIGLLAIAATAFYQATARIEKQARFEAQTTSTLEQIKGTLTGLQASVILTARPSDRSNRADGSACVSNLNLRAGISGTTDILQAVAT